MNRGIETARVRPEQQEVAPTLFPLSEYSRLPRKPQVICRELGVNWYSAVQLYDQKLLSFDPRNGHKLNHAQETELIFLGVLVAAGCDAAMLNRLLTPLRKPYAYRIDRIYYDWNGQTWRLIEDLDDLEEDRFAEWIEELVAWRELDRLRALRESVDKALLYLQGTRAAPAAWSGPRTAS
ncbi:MAG: hypothetical protein JW951_07915 [Lentisphaerae bacterium]|nr:hypothetical protein [Lentisphaerota bacterium]